jgi:ribose transport system substrate-binding protein
MNFTYCSRIVGLGLAGSLSLGLAASAAEIAVDVGNMKVPVDQTKPLSIAMFLPATNTSYLQANIKGAQDAAAKFGGTVGVFDGKLNPMNQLNEMQNAIQSGKYNAFVIFPLAGQVICKAATEDAPKAGILVATYHDPVCDKQLAKGDDQWSPGTLINVGGGSSYETFTRYVARAMKDNPGPQKVGIITGMDLSADTLRMNKVVEDVKASNPQFEVVDTQRTDYTVPTSQAKTQNMVQSHPDISIIISDYAGITRGVVDALKQAGKVGKVKVYDFGGTRWSKEAIEKGWIEVSVPLFAYTAAYRAVENIAAAREGKPVPHYIPNDGGPTTAPFFVDKTNAASFAPESD